MTPSLRPKVALVLLTCEPIQVEPPTSSYLQVNSSQFAPKIDLKVAFVQFHCLHYPLIENDALGGFKY